MELRKTLAVWLTVMTAACSCNREAFKPVDNVVFIQDARLEEAGRHFRLAMPFIFMA